MYLHQFHVCSSRHHGNAKSRWGRKQASPQTSMVVKCEALRRIESTHKSDGLARKRSALRQVLHLLRGCMEPGSAFCAAPDGGVSPAPGLHVAHLSPGALQRLLQRFAAAGESMRRCKTASLLLLSQDLGAVCFSADSDVLAMWVSSL